MALNLFGNNEKGFLYDFAALAGAHGDPVAAVSDLSGNGNNLAQLTAAKQPKIADFGARRGLSFDGLDDALTCASVDLAGATAVTLLVGIRYYGDALGIPLEHGLYMNGGGFGVYANNGAQVLGTGMGTSQYSYSFMNLAESTKGQPAVLAVTLNPGASGAVAQQNLRLNGADVAEVNIAAAGGLSSAVFGNFPLYIGARTGSVYFSKCDLFGVVCIDRELTAQEMADAEAWLLSRVPPAMNKARRHFDLHGSLLRVDHSTHVEGDAYSYAEFVTEASAIEVESYSTMVGLFPTLADIGVTVNGQFHQRIRHAANGTLKTTIALPAGTKTVRIINGPQARANPAVGSPWYGTWVKAFTADAPLRTAPDSECLFVYGDSIATGAWATDTQAEAWIPLVREALGIKVAAKAIGSQTLYDDCSTLAAARDFADRIARIAPTKIWLAIGTNDYGLGRWSAAAFGTAYGNLLDAMRELMPWAEVYAQTPLLRAETAVQAYSDAIAAACSTRSWVTLVDGTAIMPLVRLPDGLHPDTAGHQMYADYVASAIA